MKAVIPIALGILAVLVISGCTQFIPDVYTCDSDADCVSVTDGCCGCSAGGSRTAINKDYLDYWNEKLSGECQGILCPQVMSGHWTCSPDAGPKCVDGKCQMECTTLDCSIGRPWGDIRKVYVESPGVTAMKSGDTGTFAVVINNTYNETLNYYMNVYLEQVGGELGGEDVSLYRSKADGWLTFRGEGAVAPVQTRRTDLIVKPADADKGIYLFMVVVCTSLPCDNPHSPSIYGSAQFTLEVRD